jgi:hypothetical protein
MILCKGGLMTNNFYPNNERQNTEKGVFYPFSEMSMKLLDQFIEEARKEIFQERVLKNEPNKKET